MKHLCLVFLSVLFAAGLDAQTNGSNTTTLPHPIPFTTEETLTATPVFLLAPGTELRHAYTQTSIAGRTHVKYHQYQAGLRVLSGTVVFHLADDLLYATTGYLPAAGQTERDFLISVVQSEQLALLRLSRELRLSQGLRVKKTSRAFANAAYPEQGGETVAVYIVRCAAESGPEGLPIDTDVIVSAATGRVLTSLSHIHSETVPGHGDGFYLQGLTFPVDSLAPDAYELRDESRGQGIFAYDISNNLGTPTDEDNEWTPELEGHQAMIDGYYGSVKFFDFLQDRFNRNSIDDAGFPLVANMNRHTFVNAFWNGSETTYGNGECDRYSPLTTLTIVGHEYAHGLTQFTSGLIYRNESGALNESISDILGKALQFDYNNDGFDWRVGSDIRRSSSVRYFRDMADPARRFHPKFYKGENWRTGPADAGGVHSNSGVFNHWFYLLVEGKRGLNEEEIFYDVEEIGMDSALQLVYLLETGYLTESSGYEDCHDYSLLAAAELFGEGSDSYEAVVEAWKAVGLPIDTDTADNSIALEVLSGIINTDNLRDFRFCPAELEDLIFAVEELPGTDEIPNGSLLNGTIVFSYFSPNAAATVNDTTFFIDLITSPDNYSSLGELTLNLSHQLEEGVSSIDVAGDFSVTTPGQQGYVFSTADIIFINDLVEPELAYRSDNFGPACETPEIIYQHFSFDLPRCTDLSSGTLRMVFTNGTEELVVEKILENISGDDVGFTPKSEVDFEELGGLNGISYTITYLRDGTETLMVKDSYSRLFANEISEETTYPFDDRLTAERGLGIGFCANCPPDFTEEKLSFRDTSFIDDIQDCIPLKEYLPQRLRGSRNGSSSIMLCVDATEVEEPHLAFRLSQEDSDDFSDRENQYLHLVDVYDEEGSILDEPITSTGGEDMELKIPLEQSYIGTLTVHVISDGVTTSIDDIGITAGAPSPVREFGAGDFNFRYLNPIADRLRITSGPAVPLGTYATIISSTGQTVASSLMQGNSLEIGTATLPAGMYFLVISDDVSFQWTGKVVRR